VIPTLECFIAHCSTFATLSAQTAWLLHPNSLRHSWLCHRPRPARDSSIHGHGGATPAIRPFPPSAASERAQQAASHDSSADGDNYRLAIAIVLCTYCVCLMFPPFLLPLMSSMFGYSLQTLLLSMLCSHLNRQDSPALHERKPDVSN
jgi:hypothetical protein